MPPQSPSSASNPKPAASRARTIAVASLLGATLFWAGNYIVGAGAVASIDPVSLVFLRWALAAVPLLVIAQLVEKPRWRELLRAWPWLLLLSCLGLLGYNLFLYAALEHTSAFNASLINAFNPALIAIAAALFLRQKLTSIAVVGIIVALIGVLVVLSEGNPLALLETGFGTGQLLMIGAILVWTAYTIAGRLAPKLPPISSTALQALITVAILAPITLLTGGPTLPDAPGALASLLFIAVFPSVLSYLLWNRALTVIPAAQAGVFLNLLTVFTVLFTVLSGQEFSVAELTGGVIVIAGVVVTNARAFGKPKAAGQVGPAEVPGDPGRT